MKKRVSILIYSLGSGGAERVVSILLNELKDIYELELVLMSDIIFYDIPKNIKISYLEKSNPYENPILKLLKLPFLAFKYKKIVANSDVSLSFMNRPNYINLLAKIFGMKNRVIISERAMPSMQYGYNNIQSKINKFLIKKLYNFADLIIANSKGNGEDLRVNFKIKQKIINIYNPINIDKIYKLSHEDVNFDFTKYTFITIGRLDEGKNHKLLIEAFSKIKNPNSQLIVIGDGVLKDKLLSQIRDLNLENRVFLIGTEINPYKYLSKSKAFVFSSNHEGFPNVLLEALACSIPIVSTDCRSGPREILSPNSDFNLELKDSLEITEFGILSPINSSQFLTTAMDKIMNTNFDKKLFKDRLIEFEQHTIINKFIKAIDNQ